MKGLAAIFGLSQFTKAISRKAYSGTLGRRNFRLRRKICSKHHAISEMMSRLGNCENKQSKMYNGVFSVSKKGKGKGRKNYTLTIRNHKKTRKKFKHNETPK